WTRSPAAPAPAPTPGKECARCSSTGSPRSAASEGAFPQPRSRAGPGRPADLKPRPVLEPTFLTHALLEQVHPRLIPGLPLHLRAARLQRGLDLGFVDGTCPPAVVIDDVDVVESRLLGLVVDRVPDGVAQKAGRDVPVRKTERLDGLQAFHPPGVALDELDGR